MTAICAVFCQVNDPSNQPLKGAVVEAVLSAFDISNGYVAPKKIEGITDDLGQVILNLWPNELGATATYYKVKITSPNGKTIRTTAVVPNAATAKLHLISEIPPFEGKTAARVLLDDLNRVSTLVSGETSKAQTFALNAAASAAAAVAAANSIASGGLTDRYYAHDQAQADTAWSINHNMNKYPAVTITDSAGDQVEGEVHYDSLNALTVKFSAPFAGKAYLN